eukprot:283310-Chlamydomonas_euryale.AAC.3
MQARVSQSASICSKRVHIFKIAPGVTNHGTGGWQCLPAGTSKGKRPLLVGIQQPRSERQSALKPGGFLIRIPGSFSVPPIPEVASKVGKLARYPASIRHHVLPAFQHKPGEKFKHHRSREQLVVAGILKPNVG